MRSIDCLQVVLAVRRRREEVAERALAVTAKGIVLLRSKIEQARCELAEIRTSRVREIQSVATAAQYQSGDARHRTLLQQCAEAEKEMQRLEALRAEQMIAYVEARRASEVVGELEERSRADHESEVSRREQKWDEDMFLARRVSNSNRITKTEDLDGSKESA